MSISKEPATKPFRLGRQVLDLSKAISIRTLSKEVIQSSIESYYRHVDNKFTYTFSLQAITYQQRYFAIELTLCEDPEKDPSEACLLRLHFYSGHPGDFCPGQIYRGDLQANTIDLTELVTPKREQALASPFEGEQHLKDSRQG